MISPFNGNGYLPPGVHKASLDEIAERFGRQSEMRSAEAESLRWLVDLARQTGVKRLILNGSFVTQILEPNDVDCVLLVPSDFLTNSTTAALFKEGLPFLEINLVTQREFDYFVERFFATDRHRIPKGIIEVLL